MLKRSPEMTEFRKIEQHIQATIYQAFGCPAEEPSALVEADKLMVEFEAKHGFTPGCFQFDMPGYAFPNTQQEHKVGEWHAWSWQYAEQAFKGRFELLTCPG